MAFPEQIKEFDLYFVCFRLFYFALQNFELADRFRNHSFVRREEIRFPRIRRIGLELIYKGKAR